MPLHYLAVAHAPNSFVIQLSSEEQDSFSFTGDVSALSTRTARPWLFGFIFCYSPVVPIYVHFLCMSISAGWLSAANNCRMQLAS